MNHYEAWNALQLRNPEPTLLDAIKVAEPSTRYRVEVHLDHCPPDPRQDMDLVCEIAMCDRMGSKDEHLTHLISDTKGYAVVEQMADAVDGEYPDLYDEDVRDMWLEQLAATELKVQEFWTGNHDYRYIAHTTPEMCAKLGVPWEDAEKAMGGDVSLFQQYAEGDVWGFITYEWTGEGDPDDDDDKDNWREVDSCWGFYSTDEDNGMKDHVPEEAWPQLIEALRNPIY